MIDDDPERDRKFAAVFATPEGKALLADLAARGRQVIPIPEIKTRIARARTRWEMRAPQEPEP
jgi:hypothetical protein